MRIVDIFVSAPVLIFTELLTITEVMGIPPTRPVRVFPIPWATSSRFGGVFLLWGSSSSAASMASKLAIEAIRVIVIATPHTCGLVIEEKSGYVTNSESRLISGMFTRCTSSRCNAGITNSYNKFSPTPRSTTTKAGGNNLKFLSGVLSQKIMIPREIADIINAPGVNDPAK